jgi:excisionase family DNA binding protein
MALPQGDQIPRKLVPIRKNKKQPGVVPTNADLTRFLERRRAQKLGFELPMNTEEAAAYVGNHPKTVERWARTGEIPAHPVSGVRRKTWRFFPSELDAWLRSKVNSRRYPCSPDGKDSID